VSDELPDQPKTLQDISDDWKHRDDKPPAAKGKRAKSKSAKSPEPASEEDTSSE